MAKEYTIATLSPFKHEKEEILGSRAGMFLEAKFILSLANRIGKRPFYQAYNCDFRGRIYPLTPYLHEQSSDNAKGLLTYGTGVPLGESGAYWLGVHLANSIGEDKLKLDERVEYVEGRMEEIIGWAENPLVNTGWMDADKPWSSLACAFEFKKLQDFVIIGGNDVSEYICHVPIFIDGSNNGVQHLTALSLDEEIAPLVNLVPTEVPGDVYMYVADRTWEALDAIYEEMGDVPVKKELPRLLAEIKGHKMKREVAKNKAEADEAFGELDAWRKDNAELLSDIHVPFWRMFRDDKKLQRKTVKRPVMTLGYGVTKRGVQDQVFEDTKGLSEELKFKDKPNWTTPFADLLRDTMLAKLKGPALMLELFRSLAEKANVENRYLAWNVPLTNFPAVQEYNRLKKVEVRVQFCSKKKNGLQLVIQPEESGKLNKSKQLTGAAPNIIHSFDAAHLTLIVNESPFIVTTVHDSFGCHPGNMEDLFRITREEFVRFYESDPLAQLLAQTDCLELYPERGSLVLNDVMESDFAFC
jgi:DNA-directed RNA polymerase